MSKNNGIVVGIVEPVGGHGGMDYYDFSLCQGLVESGVTPILITCDKTDASSVSFEVKKTYCNIFGEASFFVRGVRFLWGSLKGFSILKKRHAGAVHFHFFHAGPLELFNVLLGRALGFKVVITAHDVESFDPSWIQKTLRLIIYKLASSVIAHNQISARELNVAVNVPVNKINVIPHGNYLGFDNQNVGRDESRDRLGMMPSDFVVMFFGQIKEVKGLDILIKSLALIEAGVRENVVLFIAGKVWKDSFGRYQQLINELGLEKNVKVDIRYIPDPEVLYYYRAADVMALPYKKIYQSGVVLMAMSFGTPVLVSDIPGMVEVVTDDETGIVFRSESAEDLAKKIEEAIMHKDKLPRYAESALSLMKNKYNWSGIAEKTRDVYVRVLN